MPIPRVDVVYRKTSALDWSEQVSCPKCNTRWKARVQVAASGTGAAAYGIGRDAAKDRAGIDAFTNASEAGERLIRLSKCPKCGHRRVGAVSLWGLAVGFVAGFLASGVFSLIGQGVHSNALAGLGCLVGPVVMVWVARLVRQREFAEADASVVAEPLA